MSSHSTRDRNASPPSPSDSLSDAQADATRGELHSLLGDSAAASPIGIDTIKLMIDRFTVTDTPSFDIRQHFDPATGEVTDTPLFRTPADVVVYGQRAILNTDRFQVTILRTDCLFVQCSLPIVLRGNNCMPVHTAKSLQTGLQKLLKLLADAGLQCSLDDGTITRVDLCRNVRTDANISAYESGLKRLSVPYLTHHDHGYPGVKWASRQGGSGSSERTITFYCKSSERNVSEPNIQRLECRLKKRRAVKRHLGFDSPARLLQDFPAVRECYRTMVRTLFPAADDEPSSADSTPSDTRRTRSDDGSALDLPADPAESSAERPSVPLTAADIAELITLIREEHGRQCHVFARLLWVLLWIIHPSPDDLFDKLEEASDSDDAPTGGRYQVRRKAREARSHAQHLAPRLATEEERLAELRDKLLAQ
jgi:hypothetical protein